MGAKLAAERDIGDEALRVFLGWITAVGIVGLGLAFVGRLRHAAIATVAFTAVLWTAYGLGLAPALDASSSAKGLMTRVGDHLGPEAELGMIAWREQNLLQADRPVVDFGFKQPWQAQWNEAATWLAAAPNAAGSSYSRKPPAPAWIRAVSSRPGGRTGATGCWCPAPR